jgi:hypothetical protein
MIGTYRELAEFIEAIDTEARARGEPEDKSIDVHFRSGVYLGVGCSHLILSLMPGKILTIVELFGYKGDRMTGLEYLNKCGGWSSDSLEPSVSKGIWNVSIACYSGSNSRFRTRGDSKVNK